MTYPMKPLLCNPSRLNGLSEKLIVSHYENNYGGAVKRLNAITEQLRELDFAKARVFSINGLKREELTAANSMILHELYFDGLGATELPARVGVTGRARRNPAKDRGGATVFQPDLTLAGPRNNLFHHELPLERTHDTNQHQRQVASSGCRA